MPDLEMASDEWNELRTSITKCINMALMMWGRQYAANNEPLDMRPEHSYEALLAGTIDAVIGGINAWPDEERRTYFLAQAVRLLMTGVPHDAEAFAKEKAQIDAAHEMSSAPVMGNA